MTQSKDINGMFVNKFEETMGYLYSHICLAQQKIGLG